MMDLEIIYTCPSCGSRDIEDAERMPWVDRISWPMRLYAIQRKRCKNCGFEGDEGVFMDVEEIARRRRRGTK